MCHMKEKQLYFQHTMVFNIEAKGHLFISMLKRFIKMSSILYNDYAISIV